MRQSQISSSGDLSDSQGFANFMAAKDKNEERQAFKQSMPTTTQAQERSKVPNRMQMYQNQYQNPYGGGGYQDQDYGFEEESVEENDDPYHYDINIADKKDEATNKYQERKKQLEKKRQEAKLKEEEEQRREKEEEERLQKEMEKRSRDMYQSNSSMSSTKENKYSKMQNEMKAFIQKRLQDDDSEELSDSGKPFKDSNSKYQESMSKSLKQSGDNDDYSVMSSVKRSHRSSSQAQEYVHPNEMAKYLAKTQPELIDKIEQEKKNHEIEQLKISSRLSQLRESQEKSLSNDSQAEKNKPTPREEQQNSNRDNFNYNPNAHKEINQFINKPAEAQPQQQDSNRQNIQKAPPMPQMTNNFMASQAQERVNYAPQQQQQHQPILHHGSTPYNQYYPHPNDNTHFYQQEIDHLMQRLQIIETENVNLKQDHGDLKIQHDYKERYKNHREQYYREQSEQRAHIKFQQEAQLKIEEQTFEIEKQLFNLRLTHQVDYLNKQIESKDWINHQLLEKLRSAQVQTDDRQQIQEQLYNLQKKHDTRTINKDFEKELNAQEVLINGYQKENEKLSAEIKSLKKQMSEHHEAYLSQHKQKQQLEFKYLNQTDQFMLVEDDPQLNSHISGKVINKQELQDAKKQIGDLKQELLQQQIKFQELQKTQSIELDKYKIQNKKMQQELDQTLQSKENENYQNYQNELQKQNTQIEQLKEDNNSQYEKLKWYAENQQSLAKQFNDIQSKQTRINELEKKVKELIENPGSKLTKEIISKSFQEQKDKDKNMYIFKFRIQNMQKEIKLYEQQLSAKDPAKAAQAQVIFQPQKQISQLRELNDLRDANKALKDNSEQNKTALQIKLDDMKQQYNKLYYLKYNEMPKEQEEDSKIHQKELIIQLEEQVKKLKTQLNKTSQQQSKDQSFTQPEKDSNRTSTDQQLNKLKEKNQQLEQQVSELKNELASQPTDYQKNVAPEIRKIDNEQLREQIKDLKQQNADLQQSFKNQTNQIQLLQSQNDQKQKMLDDLSQNQISQNRFKQKDFELQEASTLLDNLQAKYSELHKNLEKVAQERDDLKTLMAGMPKVSQSVELDVLERKIAMLQKNQSERTTGTLGYQEKKRLEKIIEDKDVQIKEFRSQFVALMEQIKKYKTSKAS